MQIIRCSIPVDEARSRVSRKADKQEGASKSPMRKSVRKSGLRKIEYPEAQTRNQMGFARKN